MARKQWYVAPKTWEEARARFVETLDPIAEKASQMRAKWGGTPYTSEELAAWKQRSIALWERENPKW